MIEALSLSNGGGINGVMEKVEQQSNAATIAIGLGGTGLDAVRTFKKMVHERVKQDNYDKRDTEAAEYNRVKFLVIDTDSTSINHENSVLSFANDFFDIGATDVVAELQDTKDLDKKTYLNWLNREIDVNRITQGAGSVRQVGKYLLSKKASQLYNRVKTMITSAVTGINGATLNVYIMAGIGGGTGSGTFIDVSYIVKKAIVDSGFAGSASVMGFFFLPDVNLSKPGFRLNGPEEKTLKENGYAAIQELDYLMNIPTNGDRYTEKYDDSFGVDSNEKPVTYCYLLSTKTVNGDVVENGYDYVMNVVSEFALNFVVTNEEVDKTGTVSGISVEGIMANLDNNSSHIDKRYGANYSYALLGASCATVPYSHIGTYLAIKFFDTIKYITKNYAVKSDVEQFCQNVGLIFNRLDQEVTRGFESFPDISDFSIKDLMAGDRNHLLKPLNRRCEDWKSKCAAARKTNIHTLGQQMEEFDAKTAPESVVGKIFKELIRIIQNVALGPYFAYSMLHNAQQHTIMAELAGIKEEVKRRRDLAQRLLPDKYDQMAKAFDGMGFTFGIPHGKEKYLSCVEEVFRTERDKETYSDFLDLLDKIEEELRYVTDNYFRKYVGIIDELISTFESNKTYFQTNGMKDKMYTWSIIDVNSISSQLDDVIKQYTERDPDTNLLVAPQLVKLFNDKLLDNRDRWIDENEVKICDLISEFITSEFKGAMNKNMVEFLEQKYNVKGNNLITAIADKILYDKMIANAKPLFEADSTVVDLKNPATHTEYVRLSIPNDATMSAAAKKCKETHPDLNMGIAASALKDRIFMLEFYSAIPMCAYRSLEGFEKVHHDFLTAGAHLKEGKDEDWRKDLPSVFPANFIQNGYRSKEPDKLKSTLELYDKAKELGVLVEDKNGLAVNIYLTPNNEAVTLSDGWDSDFFSVSKEIARFSDMKETYKENRVLQDIPYVLKGGLSHFEDSVKDDFVRMIKIVAAVKKEVEYYQSILDSITMLNQKRSEFLKTLRADFIRALYCGVIIRDKSSYLYKHLNRGVEEEILLTASNELFEYIPVYRAFVGYTALEKEVMDEIRNKANALIERVSEETLHSAEDYQQFYKGVYKDYKKEAENKEKYEASEEIVDFLDELYDSLDKFIANNK